MTPPPINLLEYSFKHICAIEPIRDDDGTVRLFLPQDRYNNHRLLPLNSFGSGPFCKFTIPRKLAHSGVYVITVDGGLQYIGECVNLSKRYNMGYGNISPRNCYSGGQETNCRLNNLIYKAVVARQEIALWFLETIDYKSVEAQLRLAYRPPWNRI